MSDIIDNANDMAERQLKQSIEAAKMPVHNNLIKGRCNYCGETVEGYFCDTDCRDDYDHEQHPNKRITV